MGSVAIHKFLRFHKRNHRTSRKMVSDAEYLKMAEEAYRESINIAKSDGWNVEKEDKANNVVVEMKKNKKGRKIYRCTAKIPMPARLLVENIVDTDRVTSWNTTLTEARVLKKISDTVAISYQVCMVFNIILFPIAFSLNPYYMLISEGKSYLPPLLRVVYGEVTNQGFYHPSNLLQCCSRIIFL